jgi:hypothetical protein
MRSPTRLRSASNSAAIRNPRVAEVAHPDQNDRSAMRQPEHRLDLADQDVDVVTDATSTV